MSRHHIAVRQRPDPRTPSAFRCRASRSQGEISSPESVWLTVRLGRSPAASGKSVLRPSGTHLAALYHRPAAVRWAARGAHAEGERGGTRPLAAKPCSPEPDHTTRWWARCCFAKGDSAQRHGNTIYAMACYTILCPRCCVERESARGALNDLRGVRKPDPGGHWRSPAHI